MRKPLATDVLKSLRPVDVEILTNVTGGALTDPVPAGGGGFDPPEGGGTGGGLPSSGTGGVIHDFG